MKKRPLGLAALLLTGLLCSTALAAPTYQWTDSHDGGGDFIDDGFCVLVDPLGNVIVAGESTGSNGGSDMCVRKLRKADGYVMWETRYDAGSENDTAVSEMVWDSVGQLIVAGYIRGCVG